MTGVPSTSPVACAPAASTRAVTRQRRDGAPLHFNLSVVTEANDDDSPKITNEGLADAIDNNRILDSLVAKFEGTKGGSIVTDPAVKLLPGIHKQTM